MAWAVDIPLHKHIMLHEKKPIKSILQQLCVLFQTNHCDAEGMLEKYNNFNDK